MADREERFTALIDAVEAGAGRPDPLVLDLGCGPGSLSVRLLARLPAANVVAVDADPVTLSLGRAGYASVPGLRFADLDLREPGWVAGLGLPAGRPVDAVVSTTALHWLSAAELHDLYRTLAGLLRPGGLFLDGDHLQEDETSSPVLARLDQALEEREGGTAPLGRAGPATRRAGTSGGRRWRPIPRWPRPQPSDPRAWSTTATRARSSPSTPARSARRGSPRWARSGSAAPAGCCAGCGRAAAGPLALIWAGRVSRSARAPPSPSRRSAAMSRQGKRAA